VVDVLILSGSDHICRAFYGWTCLQKGRSRSAPMRWNLRELRQSTQAYLLGQSNPDYTDLIKQVHAVLFLATPHRGTNLAFTLNRILSLSFVGHSQKSYVSELKQNSSALEDLNENFRNVAPQLRIFNFYETLKTSVSFKSFVGVLSRLWFAYL